MMNKYRGYTISFDPKSIGSRAFDWDYAHEDFDGALYSGDDRCGSAGSLEECKEQIDEIEEWGIMDYRLLYRE